MLWIHVTSASRAAAGRKMRCHLVSLSLCRSKEEIAWSEILIHSYLPIYLFTYLLIAKSSKTFDSSEV